MMPLLGADCDDVAQIMETVEPSRLVLGTAQLGMDYGIANKTGKPDMRMARDIVCTAWEGGIRHFDTAQGYGESEQVLGEILTELGVANQALIVTKLAPQIDHQNKKDMEVALRQSIEKLKLDRLYSVLLHKDEFLDIFSTGLADILKSFVTEGLVEKIGISFYSSAKARVALEQGIISILQVPANVCDHSFYEAGIFDLAEKKGAEIYIRSVFLQGLLLMDTDNLPVKMQYAAPIIQATEELCKELNMSRQELTLSYIKQKYPHAFVVIGTETKQQLVNNLAAWNSNQVLSITRRVDEIFANIDEKIINPTLWPQ